MQGGNFQVVGWQGSRYMQYPSRTADVWQDMYVLKTACCPGLHLAVQFHCPRFTFTFSGSDEVIAGTTETIKGLTLILLRGTKDRSNLDLFQAYPQ